MSPFDLANRALLLAGGATAAEIVVVDDTTFDESDWEFVKLPTQPDECLVFHDPTGISVCGQQAGESSDGDGFSFGGLSEITGEGVVTTDLIVGAHVEDHLAYSLGTSGAVTHLDAQFELLNLGATQGVTSRIPGHLIVEQGGSFYISLQKVSVTSTGGPAGFLSFVAIALDSGDFSRVTAGAIDPTSHPDFSDAGAPLRFGFGIDLSWDGELPDNQFVTDFLVRTFRIDEFSVTVTTASASIPGLGPATRLVLMLILAGAGVLAGARAMRG